MAITNAAGLPVAACLASASTHEVKLAETVLDSLFIAGKPEKLIGDKAYDCDKLDNDLLKKHSVEMIAPQPDKAKNSGRTEAEAVSTPLESRAAFRLAAKLQATGCQI